MSRYDDMDQRYLTLDIPDTNLSVAVKMDDEGIVIDVIDNDLEGTDDELVFDGVVASTWKLYPEFGIENIKFKG